MSYINLTGIEYGDGPERDHLRFVLDIEREDIQRPPRQVVIPFVADADD